MALRLTKQDKEKIKRVNNSGRRKNRQMDNYNIDIYMPVISATKFTSRKQLNEYLDNARKYTRGYAYKYKKNQYGTVASNIELAQAKRLAEAVSRERAKRFKKIAPEEFKSRGKGIGSSVMQRKLMGDDRYSMYDPVKLNFGSLRNREQFENRLRSFANQLDPEYLDKRNEQLRENIIQAMKDNWGKDGEKAIDFVKNMSDEDLVKEFMTEDVFNFSYIYDKTQTKRQIEIFEATYKL